MALKNGKIMFGHHFMRELKICLCLLLGMMLPAGCALLDRAALTVMSLGTPMPEAVFIHPRENPYARSRVGVFSFSEPDHARGTGENAARALYHELLNKRAFVYISNEISPEVTTAGEMLDVAVSKGYDLMITGEVSYYFDGSAFMHTKINETIQVIHVPNRRILWSAVARGVSAHTPAIDALIFQTNGRPAEPGGKVLQKNAEKFCNMLLMMPARSNTSENRLDTLLTAHRSTLQNLQADKESLRKENDLLAEKLFEERQKGDDLSEKVDTLTAQADQLAQELKEEIAKGEITIKRSKNRTIININNNICFDTGSDVLKKKARKALSKITKTLADVSNHHIQIKGHTDNVPIRTRRFVSNWELSSARALSVLHYLLTHSKIDPSRLSAAGFGEYHPVRPNDTPENRRLNRRVDIVIVPAGPPEVQNENNASKSASLWPRTHTDAHRHP